MHFIPLRDSEMSRFFQMLSGENLTPLTTPDTLRKSIVSRCEMIPNASVELTVQTDVGVPSPVALFGFSADQCTGPSLGFFVEMNPIASELLAELQSGANSQITRLGIQVVNRLELR